MSIKELVKISRFYGKDPSFVLAGGGNTSYKDYKYLYVKASGFSLFSIGEGGFVKLDRSALSRIWEKEYPSDVDLREKQALKDLTDSRADGETKRPSVEALLHAALPQKYIVHTHPAMVNGLTCSKDGCQIAEKLFGSRCMWIPSVSPGYVLAKAIKTQLAEHEEKYNLLPDIILLENHGMFVGAETTREIKAIHNYVISTLKKHIIRKPDFSLVRTSKEKIEKVYRRLKNYSAFKDSYITSENNTEINAAIRNSTSFEKVHSSYTPDHTLYAGPEMLFVEDLESIEQDIDKYRQRNKCYPKVIAVKMTGVFAIGSRENASHIAMLFFLNALKIAVYAESFGGYKFMDKEQIDFIKNWEVEKFRSKVSLGK
ncbi:MAG: class II aldolase/adducin family protein [Nanoarchaeota archaeon]|nr:class II aldolase/adducin family protein [Nanoarchaeota archaeon]